jgi:hypothetical protein
MKTKIDDILKLYYFMMPKILSNIFVKMEVKQHYFIKQEVILKSAVPS